MRRSRTRALRDRIGLAALVAAALTALSAIAPQDHLARGWVVDATAAARVAIFGAPDLPRARVAVLGLDRRTLDAPGALAWPRAMFSPVWAELTEKAFAHGARAVAFDFVMAYDSSRLVIAGDRPLARYDDGFLKLLLTHGRAGRLVLGRSATILPAPRFRQVAGDALGLIDLPLGPGSVVREVPLLSEGWAEGGREGPPLSLPTLAGRSLMPLVEPLPDRVLVVPPMALDTLPHASVLDALECADETALRAFFKDRVVLVGSTLKGEDRIRTADRLMPATEVAPPGAPCDLVPPRLRRADESSLPGVFAHAAGIDAVLRGWEPRELGEETRLSAVALTAFTAAAIGLTLPTLGGILAALALGAGVMLAGAALLSQGLLLHSADPLLAVPLALGPALVLRLRLLDRHARLVRRTFGRFLAPVVIERMIEEDSLPRLDRGEEREVTVMFADLSGFTALSQTVESGVLMEVLNRYLQVLADRVRAHDGYVDKYVGDAVMAVWNAPAALADHPRAAVEAGLEMAAEVARMAEEDAARGRPRFRVKIGINSGRASVGNVGAADRIDYTVVGATVNIASRLEALPGIFRTEVVIGPETAEACAGAIHLLPLVPVRLKGARAPVPVFAALGRVGPDPAPDPALMAAWEAALAAFTRGDLAEAASGWEALSARDWQGSGPAAVLAEEARRLAAWAPPAANWDGAVAF